MNLDDIKIFREVALQGSMTQAAEKLGYAQSSVTARIRNLEAKLSTNLFYRNAKGVHLTPAGKICLEHSLKITRVTEELYELLNSNYTRTSLLRIGSMETTAAVRLPLLLKKFNSLYEDVELSLQTGTTEYLINQVLGYELDVAFAASPVNHPELDEIPAFKEELVLISCAEDAGRDILDIIKKRTILVFRPGCSYRALLERFLSEIKHIPLKRFEFGSLEAIIGGVESGIGISLLPRSVVESKIQQGSLAAYDPPSSIKNCTTSLITRKDAVKTTEMSNFFDLLSQGSSIKKSKLKENAHG